MFAALTILLFGPGTAGALAGGPVGTDPGSNVHVSTLPAACQSAPAGADCVAASLSYLNQARANLGQPPYALPSDFASLTPPQQLLILTDSDRALYGLAQVPGLTDGLDQAAAAGVLNDADPLPSDPNWYAFTSNWAGGFGNAVLAYEAWMYDDGLGSGNVDCTAANPSGCWGHRHNILWQFDAGGPLAMGAAAGSDSAASPGYATLIEEAAPSSSPNYTFTWGQPEPSGATAPSSATAMSQTSDRPGTGSAPARSASVALQVMRVRVRGHRLSIRVSAPIGASVYCSLTGVSSRGRQIRRGNRCTHRATFSHLPAGRYRLRISSGFSRVTRRVVVA
jgi:hypothetical protein